MQKNVKNSLLLAILLCVLIISISAISAQELDDSNDNLAVCDNDESLSIENQDVDDVQSTDNEISTIDEKDVNVTGSDSGTGDVLGSNDDSQVLNANPTVAPMPQIGTGVVSGGVDFVAVNPWATTGSLVYTIPDGVTNIKSVFVIVNVYSGSGGPAYALYSNVTLNTNNGFEVLGYEELALDISTAGDPNVYSINDHTTKQYSDYQMLYDITSKVNNLNEGDSITIGVKDTQYPGKQFDGKIKLISIFFAYDDGDDDKYTYWLNAGQLWSADTANFNLLTNGYDDVDNNISLRTIALSSSPATYKINNAETVPDTTKSGSYFMDIKWNNISSKFNKGSNTNIWFQATGASYKTVVALLVAADSTAEPSNEFYVNYEIGSDSNAGTDAIKPFKTIGHALDVVQNGGIIYIEGVNYLDDVSVNGLTINKDISIIGNGAEIDARGTGRIFNIAANTVNITGIMFKNANLDSISDDRGGALNVNGATLNINGCQFINNTAGAKSYGGAINLKSSTTTIVNSYFEDNTAGYTGGAINAENSNVLLSISESIFTKNGIPGTGWANGGAICAYNTVTITRSVFFNNSLASGKNGRSINQYSTGSLTITDSILLDGDKSVYVANGPTSLENNWWGNNDTTKNVNPKDLGYTNANVDSYLYLNLTMIATGLDVGDTADVGINLIPTDGSEVNVFDVPATLRAENGDLDRYDVTLVKGSASALYVITSVGNNSVTVNALGIEDTYSLSSGDVPSFEVVYVNATGGSDFNKGTSWDTAFKTIEKAVGVVDANGTIYVADGLYVLNYAPATGVAITKNVAIYGESVNAVISGNNEKRIFSVSVGSTLTIRNLTLTQGHHSSIGGAILIEDGGNTNPVVYGKINISDSIISDSYSGTIGGAIGSNRGTIENINNVTFINNNAPTGGALGVQQKGTIIIGENCSFIGNKATNGRGSVTYAQARVKVGKNNLFDSNVASGRWGYGTVFGYGFDIESGNVFINNRASEGGALYLGGNSYEGSGVYCIFINNTDNNGRTIAKQSTGRKLTLDHCYWGTNNPDFSVISNGAITYSDYLILTISSDKENVAVGDSAEVNVDLTKFNTGSSADIDSLPKSLPLLFTAVNGNVDPVNVELIKGLASTTYAPLIEGEGSATANIYTAAETVYFTVLPKSGTVYVNYTGGLDTNDGSSWNTAVKTLEKALTIVAEDCVIYVADGVNKLDGVSANGLAIGKNISIVGIGDNVVIDANYNGRIFNIGANTVTLSNLIFINGNASNADNKRGGALYVDGAYLTIDNCKFINNTVDVKSTYGGAINLKSSTTTIKDSEFVNNSAWSTGGAINAENSNVLLNISGSTFINNLILNNGWSAGVAICSYNTVIIDRSVFYGNRFTDPTRLGKSINQYASGSLTITNSILLDGENGVRIATGPTTLENNWWGNNNTNKDISPKDLGYTNADVGSYIVLSSVLSKEGDIFVDDIVTVTTTLNGNVIELPIVFSVEVGTITPDEATITDSALSTYNATASGDEEIVIDVLGIKNVISFKVKGKLPDVAISSVTTPWSTGIYPGVNNTFTIKLNNGEDENVENITLEVYSNESGELIASYKWDSLPTGTSTILITDPTVRPITEQTIWPTAQNNLVKFTFNLLRGEDLITSFVTDKILAYNGYFNKSYAYGGDDNIINRNYTITGDIIIATQDVSVYQDQYSRYRKETWNIETPEDAEIAKVLLFFNYNWDTSFYPEGWTLTFNEYPLVGENISFEMDRGNLGGWGAYDYGLIVFDVTDVYNINENNSFIIEKTGNCALYPSTLLVLYDMPDSNVVKDVYISDICDVYYPYYNQVGYDDLLKTVVYFNDINTTGMVDATWYAFGASGGNNDADLRFNNKTYENAFKDQSSNDCYPYAANVTGVISQNNEAWFITTPRSSTVVAYEQILVVTRTIEPFVNELIIPDNLTADSSANITLTLPEDATGSVVISVCGKDYPAEIKNGNATVTIDNLPVGNHTIVAVYSGDGKYDYDVVIGCIEVSKVDPVITIDDIEGSVGDTVDVTVTIAGGDATGYILFYDKYYVVENGQATVPVTIEISGMQAIAVGYTGDDKYNNGTGVKAFNAGKAASSISADVPEDADVDEDLPVTVTVTPEGATGNYSVFIDGVDVTSEYGELIIVDGQGSFILPGLTEGNHTIGIKYNGDVNYEASEMAEYIVEVSKIDIVDDIEIEGSKITYGENATVTLTGLPEDATGTVTVTIDGKEYTADVEEGIAVVEIPDLDADIYELFLVEYSGDDKYTNASGMATIEVEKAFVDWDMDDDGIEIDVNENVTISIYDVSVEGATGTLNVTINGIQYGLYSIEELESGIELTGFTEPGEYYVVVEFLEDPNYDYADARGLNVFVRTIDADMEVDLPVDVEVGDVVVVAVELPEDATGDVTVFVDGKEMGTVELEEGKANIPIEGLTAGDHTISVIYFGDDKYSTVVSENMDLTVSKVVPTLTIEADDIEVGEDAVITVTVPDDATGNVLVSVGDAKSYGEIKDGKATVIISGLSAGNKTVSVTFVSSDDKYNQSENSTKFAVNKVDDYNITIDAAGDTDNTVVDVQLPSDATGNVTVTDEKGNSYTAPVVDGNASVDVPGLPEGENNLTVSYSGDDKYGPLAKNITANTTKADIKECILSGGKLEMTVGDGSKFTVTLTDKNGNPISGKGIKITISGKTYTVKTNANGEASLPINLKAGSYPVSAVFNGDANYKPSNVVSTSVEVYTNVRIAENKDLVKDYKDDSKPFKVRALDKYGKPVGAYAKVKMTISGKTYTVNTDANGYATLPINLGPGTYQITTQYGGTTVINQITVRKK